MKQLSITKPGIIAVFTVLAVVAYMFAAYPAVANHNGAVVNSDVGVCGETTLTAAITDPEGTHVVGNMQLIVSANGDTQAATIPTDGSNASITVGPFGEDTTIMYRVFGGGERDYDDPLWNGYPDFTSPDLAAYIADNGDDWTTAGPDDPNPFVEWHELTVEGCDAFFTGGGNIDSENGKKKAWTFGGTVGIQDGEIGGNFQVNDHSGPGLSCHFNEFSDVAFSSDGTTISFHAEGTCKDKGQDSEVSADFTITDNGEPGKDSDMIEASGDITIASTTIDGGNFQVRPSEDLSNVAVGADSDAYTAPTSCTLTVNDDGTADHTTIQGAVDAASAGDVICVADGAYNEFTVDKGVMVAGLSNPVNGSAVVSPSTGAVTQLALIDSSDVTITGLKFDGNGTTMTGNQAAGVRIAQSGADVDNVNVTYNVFSNLHTAGTGTHSMKGIQWHDGASSGSPNVAHALTNSTFAHNVIDNLTSENSGAYGVQTVGDTEDLVIENNTISNIVGSWGAGIALDSHEKETSAGNMIRYNHIMDGVSAGGHAAVQVEANVDGGGVAVNLNNIQHLLYGGSSGVGSSDTLNAENNYWGDNDPSDDVFTAPPSNDVDFDPWVSSAFPLN